MRWCILLFLGSAVFSQTCATPEASPLISANANEFVDQLLTNVRHLLVNYNLDPFKLANVTEEFWFEILFVNNTGKIDLSNGWLQDISTIRRGPADALVKYDHKLLTITFDIVFDDLYATYNYVAKVLTFTPDGLLKALITKPEGKVSLLVDLEQIKFELQAFEISVNGKVDIDLTGIGIIGQFVDVVVDGITTLFKDRIISSISDQIKTGLQNILAHIPPLLPPATEPPPQTTAPNTEPTVINY